MDDIYVSLWSGLGLPCTSFYLCVATRLHSQMLIVNGVCLAALVLSCKYSLYRTSHDDICSLALVALLIQQ